MREIILDDADVSVPLSWGIKTDKLVFVSGQAAFDLKTGKIVGDGIREETTKTLENVAIVLNAADASIKDVVKTTVFMTDLNDFDGMNEVYKQFFSKPYPARSVIGVDELAADIIVEIEAIAKID